MICYARDEAFDVHEFHRSVSTLYMPLFNLPRHVKQIKL